MLAPCAHVVALLLSCAGWNGAWGQTWDSKRGIAGVPRGENGQSLDIAQAGATAGANAINARWLYTWGNTPPADVTSGAFHGEYVPMIWSATTSNYQARVNNILSYAPSLNTRYVLGFNEPERADQANMSVANAITIWDGMDHQFRNAGIKLVSPAVSDDVAGRDWLASFMSTATARGLTVDAIAFHWYGSVNLSNPTASANSFLSRVDSYWNTYQKPIWITEFAGMDWNNTISTPDLIAFNSAFLKVAVAGLESRSYVERYSWWQYGNSANGGLDDTKLIDVSSNVYTPTSIGDSYVPAYGTGSGLDLNGKTPGKTIFYLEGGALTNSAGGAFVTAFAIDAMSGTSTFGGDASWSVENGFLRVRPGARLTMSAASQVTLSNLRLEVAGEISVAAGTLELGQNLTFTSGAGTYRVSGGTLLISGVANGMANPIVIQSGGTVIMDSADAATMTSPFTVNSGGTLQIGKLTSTTNVFPDAPTVTNNGSVVVYTTGTLSNMSGSGTLVVANGELQGRSNAAFTGAISITKGQWVPRDAAAFGTTAGITTIQGDQATGNITLRDGISTAEPLTLLARQGATINTPHILNSAGTNVLSGALSLSTGGSDWNLQSDAGLLVISGSIVSSPNTLTRRLKLLGAASGSFTGAIAFSNGATSSLVKSGSGSWTVSGPVSGASTIQVSQGRLALAGLVSGGTATVSAGAELEFSGTSAANNITSFAGAGTLSFTGNSTNTLTGTLSTTGQVTVRQARVLLANLRLANTGDIAVSSGLLEVGASNTFTSNAGTFRVSGGTLLVSGRAVGMSNPIVVQSGGLAIIDSSDGATMGSTFDVQPGGTLQIGRFTSNTNIFPDTPASLINNGTITVYDTESVTNMTGSGTIVAENEDLQLRSNPAFTGPISVTNGQLYLRDATSMGSAAGTVTVQGDTSTGHVLLRDGVAVGSRAFTLGGRQGTAVNNAHVLNAALNNTLAGNLTLAPGGTDYNLQSDSGTLTVSGSIVSSPGAGIVNLKLLGAGAGAFEGAITFSSSATGSLVKSGGGSWTVAGPISGADAIQASQGRLALAGAVSGGAVTVSAGAELAFVGTAAANNITSFAGAGTLSFTGGSTNTLTGTLGTTGLLSIEQARLALAPHDGAAYRTLASVNAISITANGALVVPAHSGAYPGVVVTSQISIASGALDLANNDMILRDVPAATVEAAIALGVSSSGSLGLVASQAGLFNAAVTSGRDAHAALGVVSVMSPFGLANFTTFDGVAVNATDVVVRYTYAGDTNLDGTLTAADFNAVLNGLTNNLTGWENGDINYDGVVDATDWTLFLGAYTYFQSTGIVLGNSGTPGHIPEPAALSLLAPLPLLLRRRR
jgi:hypothetical protein